MTKLKRDPTLGTHLPPGPGEASISSCYGPQVYPKEDPPTSPLASPSGPQVGRGREPLPTENSHFFAARFRNTPGLMPSGELCNQGHRSRAKQTRLCVQRRPRGSAPGREGLRPGLGVGLVCSATAAEGGRTRAPRRRGPGPSAGPRVGQVRSARARPLPHRGRPPPPGGELGPKSRRTPSPPAASGLWGGPGKCWTPVTAPFQLGTPPSYSPPVSPRS